MEEISKFPELIKSLFKNPENFDPSVGYFEIIYGNPKQIMKIENKFVCNVDQDGNKTLKYSKPFENACFLVILEKFYVELVEGGFANYEYNNVLENLGINIDEINKKKDPPKKKVYTTGYYKLNEIIDNPVLFPTEFKYEHFHQGNIVIVFSYQQ